MRLVLLVLALAAPLADAHLGGLPQGSVFRAGPYAVAFSPTPENPYVNDTVGLTSEVVVAETGFRARNVQVSLDIQGPGGFAQTRDLADDGTGYLVSSFQPTTAGNHTIRAHVKNTTTGEVHTGEASLLVFPDLGFRLRSVDPNLDIVEGQTTLLALETVDPITLRRVAKFSDLLLHVEHWSDDHGRLLGTEEIATTNPSPGLFRVEHVFPEEGMYHLRFSSAAAGFKPDDVPLLHAVATPGIDAPPQETPVPALLAVLALLLGVAWSRRG